MFNDQQKQEMLTLARSAIKTYLETGRPPRITAKQVAPYLRKPAGVFITLTLNGQLRGCIGHLKATMPLFKDITENAINAAFNDPRFIPLQENEFSKIKIEISVLGQPKPISYSCVADLLSKITPHQDGVIISKGFHKATYLPQVWEELSDKEGFLCSLCIKAGLNPYAWQNEKLDIETYQVEKFAETNNSENALKY
jgi:AmmeMemoRadiSam system protein A